MTYNGEKAFIRAFRTLIELSLAIIFASQLTIQECNQNEIKAFPRVLGVSTYNTITTQMDTNE
jgi:hypothetical protein